MEILAILETLEDVVEKKYKHAVYGKMSCG